VLVVSEVCVSRYGAECEKRGWVFQSNISRVWRGAGSSGLFRLFGLFSLSYSGSEINKNNQPIPSRSCHQL
jgi:hypothetical protein